VAGFVAPPGVGTYELFATVALALATGEEPPAALASLWDGLEAFPAHDDEVEPAVLAAVTGEVLGIAPDAAGLADHDRIGEAWERAGGRLSIVDALFDQLGSG
jgi:hypothetical protein